MPRSWEDYIKYEEGPCEVCGKPVDECECPECPECHEIGWAECTINGGPGCGQSSDN